LKKSKKPHQIVYLMGLFKGIPELAATLIVSTRRADHQGFDTHLCIQRMYSVPVFGKSGLSLRIGTTRHTQAITNG